MRTSKLNRHAALIGALLGIYVGTFGTELAVRSTERAPAAETLPKLLFVTFDGVRPDEFFDCADEKNLSTTKCSFPFLTGEKRAGRFEFYPMIVGNKRNLSLPGYETIFSGAAQDGTCRDNDWCSRVPVETWLERIAIDRRLTWWQVAAIASWSRIGIAFEKFQGSIYANVGRSIMKDPRTGVVPYDLEDQSRWQSDPGNNPRWNDKEGKNSRLDRFTFAYAEWYLTHVKPDILVMDLLDSDEHGHLDEFSNYKNDLRRYDGYLKKLAEDLKAIGAYENTIIIVTTDHGRGSGYMGFAFQGHGTDFGLEHSNQTWVAISVPPVLRARWTEIRNQIWRNVGAQKRFLDQTDIRTAIDGLMVSPNRH